ncbi:response regulator [Elizabethkingia argentiflava]|uniref:Response regulator n=1 Tax=Elizabethkingia argenteiflava TaxID=2681556 RepID=A0A845PQ37_9FLAO|nr:response regulator [Elizabethkingia argenteiflava]NAW50282.1 response regulator [Elizabethkingia argenteiflava]
MTNTIRCVILDDELLAIRYLTLLCEQIEDIQIIKVFNNPQYFLDEIPHIDCDLCILDIEMPGITGLQVAKELINKKIIFTTAYKEYAAEAFDLNVVDYVRKPIKKERLHQAFEKAKKLIKPTKINYIEWNTHLGKSHIFTNQILYIKTSEIDSRDKEVILTDNSRVILKNINFKTLLQMLPPTAFSQINKREVIALKAIQVISANEIITRISSDKEHFIRLSLSEVYKNHLLKKLEN